LNLFWKSYFNNIYFIKIGLNFSMYWNSTFMDGRFHSCQYLINISWKFLITKVWKYTQPFLLQLPLPNCLTNFFALYCHIVFIYSSKIMEVGISKTIWKLFKFFIKLEDQTRSKWKATWKDWKVAKDEEYTK
jgi:hypothetical protein